jgi:hypothetical protein
LLIVSAATALTLVTLAVTLGPVLTFEISRWWQMRSFGTVVPGHRTEITVSRGSKFALQWEQAVLPCMNWQIVDPVPDPRTIRPLGRERISNPRNGDGAAGELFLLFAVGERTGETDLVLDNCVGESPDSQQDPHWHERRTYHVTIR